MYTLVHNFYTTKGSLLWVVTLYISIVQRCFGAKYCSHLQGTSVSQARNHLVPAVFLLGLVLDLEGGCGRLTFTSLHVIISK
jgi:hypothetical protein